MRDRVAIVLAVGLAVAINVLTVAIVADAFFSPIPGLSENGTQILTTAFGGIIGVLGSYIGYRTGLERGRREPPEDYGLIEYERMGDPPPTP